MKLLNLSHNKIAQIHMNAFKDLKLLKTIDLSYNSIQYFLVNWFWDTESLQELYINNNNFMTLGQQVIIENQNLKKLVISNSFIHEIHSEVFTKIPNLQVLDISNNNLIQLKVDVIKPLKKLLVLNAENNSFHCNNIMMELENFCRNQNIVYNYFCVKPTKLKTEEKFQKIINLPPSENIKNGWLYNEEENVKVVIKTKEVCMNKTQEISRGKITNVFFVSIIIVPTLLGFVVGIFVGYNAHRRLHKNKRKTRTRPRTNRFSVILNRASNEFNCPLMENTFDISTSTPVTQRRTICL